MAIFWRLILAHFLADFTFQTNAVASWKRQSVWGMAVHVLTLTATPIPRTLHMSLAGLRDLTLIETAPRDRSPILTFVEPWDDGLLEEAFARELDRGGQVFVVHNRVETIDTIAARIETLAPRARCTCERRKTSCSARPSTCRRNNGRACRSTRARTSTRRV